MTDPAPRRIPVAALVAGGAALIAAALLASDELGSFGGDNAEYVLLAKSLRGGLGYRSPWAPGDTPLHVQYPPVYPLLLVPFVGSAPGSFLAAHFPAVAAAGVAVFLLTLLFQRRGLPPWAAAAAALVPALSAHWLRCAADLLSELPFMAFCAGALLLLEPGSGEGSPPLPARRILLAAACTSLAFLTRTAGLALAIPVVAALVIDPRVRGKAGWIGAGVVSATVAGWTLYGALAGSGGGYVDQLHGSGDGLFARTWQGLWRLYLPGTPSFLFPLAGTAWDTLGWCLWIFAGIAVAFGLHRRRTLAVAEAFFLLYLAMQSAWPFRDPRFAIPLAVLLTGFALENAHRISGRAAITTALAGLLLLPNLWMLSTTILPRSRREAPALEPPDHEPARLVESWQWNDDRYRAAAPASMAFLLDCDLIRMGPPFGKRFPEGAVMAANPRIAALLTGRRAVQPRAGASPDDLSRFAGESGVGIVIVDNFAGEVSESLRRWRDSNPEKWSKGPMFGSVQLMFREP